MIHKLTKEWSVPDVGITMINVHPFYKLAKHLRKPVEIIKIDDIAFKCIDEQKICSHRLQQANLDLPILCVSGMPNPYNKTYRAIDGRHRIKKSLDVGMCVVKSFVFTYDEFIKYIKLPHFVTM